MPTGLPTMPSKGAACPGRLKHEWGGVPFRHTVPQSTLKGTAVWTWGVKPSAEGGHSSPRKWG